MDMHVRIDMDDDGPVVVKTATPAAVERLRLEIDRLQQAAHPGVVTVVGVSGIADPPACELRTAYSGEPVGAWAGPVASVAGLGASVATTLADLHSVGLVHGRVDASHILVADDGRPRLCGFSHPGGAAPADDVAALATVMSDLLDRAVSAPSGSRLHRWLGGSQTRVHERALRVVLQRATDPVPTRRPNARVLADAILAAVPTADLPPPTRHITTANRHALPVPDAARPALSHWPAAPDAAVSSATPSSPSPSIDGRDAESAPSSHSPAAAQAAPHAPVPNGEPLTPSPSAERSYAQSAPSSHSPAAARPHHTPVPNGESPTTSPWTAGPGGLHAPGPGAEPAPVSRDAGAEPNARPGAGPDADSPSRTRRGTSGEPDTLERIWAAAEQGTEAERWARAVGSGPPDLPLAQVATPAWETAPGPPLQPRPTGDDGDDDSGLTVERPELAGRGGLGGRPGPASDPPAAPRHGRRRLVAALLGIVSVVALTAAAATWASHRESPPRAAGVAHLPPPGCPRVSSPAADIDGDGCPDPLTVDGATVTAGDARWTLGEPGDRVALGDWDCDGSASAALLRPPTGDVFVFPAWAELGRPVSVTPIQQVAGAVDIRTEPAGPACDSLVVDLATGPPRTIEVPE